MKKLFYVAAVALIALTACGGKKASAQKEAAAQPEQTKSLVASTEEGAMFTDLIAECEKLGDYVVNVVEARTGL